MGNSTDAPFQSLTIVGFGLIGASLAAALKARDPKVRIIGADLPVALQHECVVSLTDERCDATHQATLEAAMAATELTVLAAPVKVIERQLPSALRSARLVTDCGSTKRTIVRIAEQNGGGRHFVPGHPMAGKPMGGAAAAVSDLFEKKRWILCPEGVDSGAVERVRQLVAYVGASVVEMSAADHDRAVAVTSHVPQLFASVLAAHARQANAEIAAGPAYVSATRVAGGNLSMWRDIFSTNADVLSEVILDLAAELQQIGEWLRADDIESVLQVLKTARDSKANRGESDS
jgi:prephenate dehydrogenase